MKRNTHIILAINLMSIFDKKVAYIRIKIATPYAHKLNNTI